MHIAAVDALRAWLETQQTTLDALDAVEPNTVERLRESIEAHRKMEAAIAERAPSYEQLAVAGRQLVDRAPNNEKREIGGRTEALRSAWERINETMLKRRVCARLDFGKNKSRAFCRKRSLDDALIQSSQFDDALAALLAWLAEALPPVEAELAAGRWHGDVETLQRLLKENDELAGELKARRAGIESVRKRAGDILAAAEKSNSVAAEEHERVQQQVERLNDEWRRLESGKGERAARLNDALIDGVELCETAIELRELANDFELRCRRELPAGTSSTDLTDIAAAQRAAIEQMRDDFVAKQPALLHFKSIADDIAARAHPRAVVAVAELRNSSIARWEQVAQLLGERANVAARLHDQLREHDKLQAELGDFIADRRGQLTAALAAADTIETLPKIQTAVVQHAAFKDTLRERQPQVDELMRVARRDAPLPSAIAATVAAAAASPRSPTTSAAADIAATLNRSTTSLATTAATVARRASGPSNVATPSAGGKVRAGAEKQ